MTVGQAAWLVLELTPAQENQVSLEEQAGFPCGFSSIYSLSALLGYSPWGGFQALTL